MERKRKRSRDEKSQVYNRGQTTLLQVLQALPADLVFCHLGSSRALMQTSTVCKQWRELLQRNLTAVDATISNAKQAQHLAAFLARPLEQLAYAAIQLEHHITTSSNSSSSSHRQGQSSTGLANRAAGVVLAALRLRAPQLRQLHISSLHPEMRPVQALLDASTSRLTSLQLTLPSTERLSLPASLENLTWKQPAAVSDNSARSFSNAALPALQHLTALSALDLRDCLSQKRLPALPQQLRKLAVRDRLAQQLHYYAGLQEGHAAKIQLPALEELQVHFESRMWISRAAPWAPLLQQLPGLKVLVLTGMHGEVCSSQVAAAEAAAHAAMDGPAVAACMVLPATLRELYLEYLPCMAALAGLTGLEVLHLGPHPLVTTTPLGTAAASPAVAAARPAQYQQGLQHPEADVLQLAAAQHPKLRVLRLRGNWGPRQQLMLDELAGLTGLKELSLVGPNCSVCITPMAAGAAASAAWGSSLAQAAEEAVFSAAAAAMGPPAGQVRHLAAAAEAAARTAVAAACAQVELPTGLVSLCIDSSNELCFGLPAATLAGLSRLTRLQQLALSGVVRGAAPWAALTTLTQLTSLQLGGLLVLPQRPLDKQPMFTKPPEPDSNLEKIQNAFRGFLSVIGWFHDRFEAEEWQNLQLWQFKDSRAADAVQNLQTSTDPCNWNEALAHLTANMDQQQVLGQQLQQEIAALEISGMWSYVVALVAHMVSWQGQLGGVQFRFVKQALTHNKLLLLPVMAPDFAAGAAAAAAASSVAPGRAATQRGTKDSSGSSVGRQQPGSRAAAAPPRAAGPMTRSRVAAAAAGSRVESTAVPAAGMPLTQEAVQALKADLQHMQQQLSWLQRAMQVPLLLKQLWLAGQHPEHLLRIASQYEQQLSRFSAASQAAAAAAAQAGDQLTAAVAAPAAAAAAEHAAVSAQTQQLVQQLEQEAAVLVHQMSPGEAYPGQQGFIKLLSCLPKLQHLNLAPCNAYGEWQPTQLWEEQQGHDEDHSEDPQSLQQEVAAIAYRVELDANCGALNQRQLAEVLVDACAAATAAGSSGLAQLTYIAFGHGIGPGDEDGGGSSDSSNSSSDCARLTGLAARLKQLKHLQRLALVGPPGTASARHVFKACEDEVASALPWCKVTVSHRG